MKTFSQRKEDVVREWYIVDAKGKILGRLASEVAGYLKGKNKRTYTPHIDGGDNVIIINADKVELTKDKLDKKIYYNYSGYQSGMRERTAKEMKEKYPVEMVERAVKGMLPKGRLGRQMIKKLFVYKGENHPHQAQKPKELEIN